MKHSPYLHDACVLLVGEMLLGIRDSFTAAEAEAIAGVLAATVDLEVLHAYAAGKAVR